METQVFVQRRKALKISQVKLCQGICTQATLSKFESNRRVPALSILSKLCSFGHDGRRLISRGVDRH